MNPPGSRHWGRSSPGGQSALLPGRVARGLHRHPGIFPLVFAVGLLACGTASARVSPAWDQVARVLTLRDYNTRVVILGVTALGAASGVVGSFLLLRKRALLGDTISHATLPGIAGAFMILVALGGDGKWLPGLLLGAAVTGLLGAVLTAGISHVSRLKEDAALGIVLSVFFGAGVALLGIIQKMKTGSQAGLEAFIYGKTASMLASEAILIGLAAAVVILLCLTFYKEFRLVCFDPGFASAAGWPVFALDALLMALVVVVTVIGLQAVGLLLVIALLIIPPAAARFWSDRLGPMLLVATLIGAASGFLGAVASALTPDLPAGAVIVIVAAGFFALGLVFGPTRGVAARLVRLVRTRRRVARQHLLRALYEWLEAEGRVDAAEREPSEEAGIPYVDLLEKRSWSRRQLSRLLRAAQREELIRRGVGDTWVLTRRGFPQARRVVRNHRLWEQYLILHADIAPSHVDRDADEIEHVLGAELVEQLEAMMPREPAERALPPSPHHLGGSAAP